MNTLLLLEKIRGKYLDRQDSMDDEGWKTINGTHVLVDKNGDLVGGPETLKSWNTNRREAANKAKKSGRGSKKRGGDKGAGDKGKSVTGKRMSAKQKQAVEAAKQRVEQHKWRGGLFECETPEKFQEYLWAHGHMGRLQSDYVKLMNENPGKQEMLMEMCFGFQQMEKQIPGLDTYLADALNCDRQHLGNGFLNRLGGKNVFTTSLEEFESMFGNKETGYYPPNSTPASLAYGESAKGIIDATEYFYTEMLHDRVYDKNPTRDNYLLKGIINEAIGIARGKDTTGQYKNMSDKEMLGTISGRVKECENLSERQFLMEAVAQSFASDYAAGFGRRYNPVAEAIHRITMERYKEGEKRYNSY